MKQEKDVLVLVSSHYLDPSKKWPRLVLRVDPDVVQALQALAESLPDVEQTGILGMDRKRGVICKFYLDQDAQSSFASVKLDGALLTQVVAEWEKECVIFAGIFHSHPSGMKTLSSQDLAYARRLVREGGMKHLLMALATPGRVRFYAIGE